MNTSEYEKCVFSIIFKNADTNLPKRILAELFEDRFGSAEHRLIYRAIGKTINEDGLNPTPINVSIKLGSQLEQVGGIEYLESLVNFIDLLGTDSYNGYNKWIEIIDNAGRLRHLGSVVKEYQRYYEDFEKLVKETNDVGRFLSIFLDKVNEGALKNSSSYKPIYNAVESAKMKLAASKDGAITELIPSGLKSLYDYHIPRPSSIGGIMGLSSSGKTSLALSLLLGTAIKLKLSGQKGVCTFNSLETSDHRIAIRMGAILSGVSPSKLSDGLCNKTEYDRFYDALDYLTELPILYDDNAFLTTDELIWEATANHTQSKRVLGISDYGELFSDKASSEELRVSGIFKNHRKLAWRLGSCEIVLSQFSNRANDSGSRMGDLSNARYSGAIEHILDWGLIVYNPKQMRKRGVKFTLPSELNEDMAYVIVQKNKDYKPGTIPFNWVPECTRFEDTTLMMGETFEGFRFDGKSSFEAF